MEVHRNHMVAPSHNQHVRNELRRDGCPRLVLLVHPRIRETRYDRCDPACRCCLAGGDEDEELHEVVVDVVAARLDDEHIFVPNGLGNFHVRLPIGEFFDCDRYEWYVESV